MSGPVGTGYLPSGSGIGWLYTPGIGSGGAGAAGQDVGSSRVGAEETDLAVELFGVEALDSGRHRALVVVDPEDRRNLKGFVHLTAIHSPAVDRAEGEQRYWGRHFGERSTEAQHRILEGLGRLMSAQTHVQAEVRDAVALDDPELLEAPFGLFTVATDFTFTQAESANLGRYLTGGGFLYAEVVARDHGDAYRDQWDVPGLRLLIRAALQQAGLQEGKDWQFRRLPPDHPLFHCHHDLRGAPRGFWDMARTYYGPTVSVPPDCVEAITVGQRVVGLYSLKDYSFFWEDGVQRKLTDAGWSMWTLGQQGMPCRFGVNVLVYALTREGSLAVRLVSAE
ncbi:MAG: DUF4159 domain-containing protein [Candidatus Latescibacterota bacterium]